MDCPFCKISSMRLVLAGGKEIDRCLSCGALWFDCGEIRELTDGRLAADAEGEILPKTRSGELLKMHRQAASLACPRCGGHLRAVDFQTTGIPVLHCLACQGYLIPRRCAAAISDRFRSYRQLGKQFADLGESLAGAVKRRMELTYGPAMRPSDVQIPLPVVVPLADERSPPSSFPVVTYLLIGFSIGVYFLSRIGGGTPSLPGGLPGLPPGAGISGGILPAALFSIFLHAGMLPLAAGVLFLFVLGDNVEGRMGWLPFLFLYLLCGIIAGAAHLLWGKPGGYAALGSAGAVAGVLGAYLVFFPDVSIRMYGLGQIRAVPAYLFACAWVTAAFLIGPGPLTDLVNPAPLSLPGNIAGFAAGIGGAILWQFWETPSPAPLPPNE
jgi:membrane associated rhomboid family serine protease/Zn-finger nucleic acid-binding protein